ncbi:hypothetical protein [Abyssisolibacter fermentans]|uniref:hypothetical protein n=1 Tax=Abyssisolibacter fermentans TaxID=1766203 RepID=UPI000833C6CD|nr:hypothetical protein [Abyssisolibacter fermentans]
MDEKNKMLYKLEKVNLENFGEVEKLFDDKFFFQTSYPSIVPIQVLEFFLMKSVESYILRYGDKVIGLTYYKVVNDVKIQFKFMTIDSIDLEIKKNFFNISIEFFKEKCEFLKRLETTVFEFSNKEIEFYNQIGLKKTFVRMNEILYNQKLYKTIKYMIDLPVCKG